LTFALSEPAARLLISAVCLAPCAKLMNTLELFGARQWDADSFVQGLSGDRYLRVRMLHAHSGHLTADFLRSVVGLMFQESQWAALEVDSHTVSLCGLAFSMLSTAVCGVTAKLVFRHQGVPFKLWAVLDSGGRAASAAAKQIDTTPECLLDGFSKRFLSRHRGTLETPKTIAILFMLGLLVRTDTLRLECRNAAVRRAVKKNTQSWSRNIEGRCLPQLVSHPIRHFGTAHCGFGIQPVRRRF
jgi:hypothetical protein